jgi:hypothetical protein
MSVPPAPILARNRIRSRGFRLRLRAGARTRMREI